MMTRVFSSWLADMLHDDDQKHAAHADCPEVRPAGPLQVFPAAPAVALQPRSKQEHHVGGSWKLIGGALPSKNTPHWGLLFTDFLHSHTHWTQLTHHIPIVLLKHSYSTPLILLKHFCNMWCTSCRSSTVTCDSLHVRQKHEQDCRNIRNTTRGTIMLLK